MSGVIYDAVKLALSASDGADIASHTPPPNPLLKLAAPLLAPSFVRNFITASLRRCVSEMVQFCFYTPTDTERKTMKHFRLLKYAMFLSAFGLFPALSHGAGWRYEDEKLTDGVWSFPATLKNGINLEVDAKKGTSSATTPCVIDFSQIEGGYKVTKFGQFSSQHETYPANDKGTQLYPYRGLITEFIAPDCTAISGEACFKNCTNLTKVVLAEGVGIQGRTFEGCKSLVELEPRKFAGIQNDAFSGCSSLKGKIENTAKGTDDKPASFANNVFLGCSSLEEVVAENVKILNERVFKGCSSLTNIVLSPQISTINKWAFDGCAKLTTENVQRILHKGLVQLGGTNGKELKGGFTGCKGLTGTLVWEFTGLSTNVVPENCFEGCDSLERVDFKTPVTEFRASAFYNLKPGAEFHMTVEAPNVFASRATMTTTAPYAKVYLKGNYPAWIEVMNKNGKENIILKEAFNNKDKYIKENIEWGDIRAFMKKDTDMCSYDETENKITVNKRGVLGFLMYKQTSSGKTTQAGCWILKEPEAGFSVIVR